jgi:hypothetical protein
LPVTAWQPDLQHRLVQSSNNYDQVLEVITKALLSAAIVCGAAVGAAIPASADPSVFGNLSCSCEQPSLEGEVVVQDQINLGIERGLEDLRANQARRNLPSTNYSPAISAGNHLH